MGSRHRRGLLTDIIACPGCDFVVAKANQSDRRKHKRRLTIGFRHDLCEINSTFVLINSCGHHHAANRHSGVDNGDYEWYQSRGGSADRCRYAGVRSPHHRPSFKAGRARCS